MSKNPENEEPQASRSMRESHSPIIIVRIEYAEFEPDSYRGVSVMVDGNETRFESGNVVEDFANARSWMVSQGFRTVMLSSSIDNFLADNKDYVWDEETGIVNRGGQSE